MNDTVEALNELLVQVGDMPGEYCADAYIYEYVHRERVMDKIRALISMYDKPYRVWTYDSATKRFNNHDSK